MHSYRANATFRFQQWIPLFAFVALISLNSYGKCQGSPLFLTPLIDAGLISEARNASLVRGFQPQVQSFSGLITVNKEYNSNMFFWFFPAEVNSSTAPLMLYTEGGPGLSGLHSMFNMVGPFDFQNGQMVGLRNTSWHKTHNIIFLDNPVQIGFSFTDNEAGFIDSSVNAAPNTYEFLIQFLTLFPEYQRNDFFNAGVSFGANYASALGAYIHMKNSQNPPIRINLKGLFLESPFIDPPNQIVLGDFLYGVGLIDGNTRNIYNIEIDTLRELISQGRYSDAYDVYANMPVLIQEDTGFPAIFNILQYQFPNLDHTSYVNTTLFRSALHVGNLPFTWRNSGQASPIFANAMNSVKPYLEEILNASDNGTEYRTLIVTGNVDITTNHLGVQNMIDSFNWTGLPEFTNTKRNIWRDATDNAMIAGYSKTAQGFTYVMMRNAGHTCGYDQPDWTFQLINKFTRNIPIV